MGAFCPTCVWDLRQPSYSPFCGLLARLQQAKRILPGPGPPLTLAPQNVQKHQKDRAKNSSCAYITIVYLNKRSWVVCCLVNTAAFRTPGPSQRVKIAPQAQRLPVRPLKIPAAAARQTSVRSKRASSVHASVHSVSTAAGVFTPHRGWSRSRISVLPPPSEWRRVRRKRLCSTGFSTCSASGWSTISTTSRTTRS